MNFNRMNRAVKNAADVVRSADGYLVPKEGREDMPSIRSVLNELIYAYADLKDQAKKQADSGIHA